MIPTHDDVLMMPHLDTARCLAMPYDTAGTNASVTTAAAATSTPTRCDFLRDSIDNLHLQLVLHFVLVGWAIKECCPSKQRLYKLSGTPYEQYQNICLTPPGLVFPCLALASCLLAT